MKKFFNKSVEKLSNMLPKTSRKSDELKVNRLIEDLTENSSVDLSPNTISQLKSTKDSGADESLQEQSIDLVGQIEKSSKDEFILYNDDIVNKDAESFKAIAKALAENKSIKKISIFGFKELKPELFKILIDEFIAKRNDLEVVKIIDTKIDQQNFKEFLQAIEKIQPLKVLTLEKNGLEKESKKDLADFIPEFSNLQHLNLKENNVNLGDAKNLAAGILKSKSLIGFSGAGAVFLADSEVEGHLKGNKDNMNRTSQVSSKQEVQENSAIQPRIQTPRIQTQQFQVQTQVQTQQVASGKEEVEEYDQKQMLAETFKDAKYYIANHQDGLFYLELIGPLSKDQLKEMLKIMVENETIDRVQFNIQPEVEFDVMSEIQKEFIEKRPDLKEISFFDMAIKENEVTNLAKAIENHKSLDILSLNNCGINDNGVKTIMDLTNKLKRSLKALDLANNDGISDKGLDTILTHLQHNTFIEHLGIVNHNNVNSIKRTNIQYLTESNIKMKFYILINHNFASIIEKECKHHAKDNAEFIKGTCLLIDQISAEATLTEPNMKLLMQKIEDHAVTNGGKAQDALKNIGKARNELGQAIQYNQETNETIFVETKNSKSLNNLVDHILKKTPDDYNKVKETIKALANNDAPTNKTDNASLMRMHGDLCKLCEMQKNNKGAQKYLGELEKVMDRKVQYQTFETQQTPQELKATSLVQQPTTSQNHIIPIPTLK